MDGACATSSAFGIVRDDPMRATRAGRVRRRTQRPCMAEGRQDGASATPVAIDSQREFQFGGRAVRPILRARRDRLAEGRDCCYFHAAGSDTTRHANVPPANDAPHPVSFRRRLATFQGNATPGIDRGIDAGQWPPCASMARRCPARGTGSGPRCVSRTSALRPKRRPRRCAGVVSARKQYAYFGSLPCTPST